MCLCSNSGEQRQETGEILTKECKIMSFEQKGLIHVYTGDGKGKTTCGVGLALRSLGHGKSVVYAHFHKEPEKYGYAEKNMLEKNGAKVFGFANGCPMFNKNLSIEQLSKEATEALEFLSEYLKNNTVDLLILDEINISTYLKCLTTKQLLEFISKKPKGTELVLTGRYAEQEILEQADYVSFIKKEKHPYDKGVKSRKGIEY